MIVRRPAPRPHGRPARAGGRLAAIAATVLMAQLLPAASVGAREPVVAPEAGTAELQPGIHYEDALAHADDHIEFAPGGRVTVGFRPRSDDTWDVAGKAPRALPAGSASGRQMRPAQTAGGLSGTCRANDTASYPGRARREPRTQRGSVRDSPD